MAVPKGETPRLFTEVKPCWMEFISGWVTKSTASDIEISSLLNRHPLKQQKIRDFLRKMFEFINMLWSLIFITRLDVFLKFNKTDKVEQFGERSAIQAHANIIYG